MDTLPCVTEGCNGIGSSEYAGRCRACSLSSPSRPIGPSLTEALDSLTLRTAEPDGLVSDGGISSSRKCLVSWCQNLGHCTNNYICNSCMAYVQVKLRNIHESKEGSCVTPGCPNNSSPRTFCRDCEDIFSSPRPGALQSQVSTSQCRIDSCGHYGSSTRDGLCHECYTTFTFQCKTPNCQQLCLAKDGYLCSKCLNLHEQSATQHTQGDAGPITPLGLPSGSSSGHPSGTPSSWKQCATQGCTNVASSANGLCYECYIRQVHLQPKSGVEQHQAQENARLVSTAKKMCTTFNCQYYGNEEQNGKCSTCFKKELKASERPSSPATPTARLEPKCETAGCEFYGDIETKGLCSGCFKTFLERDTRNFRKGTPEIERKRSHSGPATLSTKSPKDLMPLKTNDKFLTTQTPQREQVGNNDTVPAAAAAPLGAPLQGQQKHPQLGVPGIALHSPNGTIVSTNLNTTQPPHGQTSTPTPFVKETPSPFVKETPSPFSISNLAKSRTTSQTCPDAAQPAAQPSSFYKDPLTAHNSNQPEMFAGMSDVDSDEIFGDGFARTSPLRHIPRSVSTPMGMFTVLDDKCKMDCGRQCVHETWPYCMACFESLQVQPWTPREPPARMPLSPEKTPREPPASMPLSPEKNPGQQHLAIGQRRQERLRSVSNPSLNSLSDICSSDGCDNLASSENYPMCDSCYRTQDTQDKADPERPGVPPRPDPDNSPSDFVDHGQQKKIAIKLPISDLRRLDCDAIICLWNDKDMNNEHHALLEVAGKDIIKDMANFKSNLLRGSVVETSGGCTKARVMLHYRYTVFSDKAIASALKKCLTYSEIKGMSCIVLPVHYCDDLCGDPALVTRVTMYVIAYVQNLTNYSQSLQRFLLLMDSKAMEELCKEEFVAVLARSHPQHNQKANRPTPNCKACNNRPVALLRPLSISKSCSDECRLFCLVCLKDSRKKDLVCNKHGCCLAPVGHRNTFALLVAGHDDKARSAKIFIHDTERMEQALKHQNTIGISDDNIHCIVAQTAGKAEDITSRVQESFLYFREQLQDKPHSVFIFYYSGHYDRQSMKVGDSKNKMTPQYLKREFRKLKAEKMLVILDCCYSDSADFLQDFNSDDYTSISNSISKDDSESDILLPKLWNLDDSDDSEIGSKGDSTLVKQWSSSMASEKSYFDKKKKQSFFTQCIVTILQGYCPIHRNPSSCKPCKEFREKVTEADGVFLETIHEVVEYHVAKMVCKLNYQQRPVLDGNCEDDLLFAYHTF